MPIRSLALLLALGAPSLFAATFRHVVPAGETAQRMVLRREGARLLIADAASGAVVASARAAAVDRVVVQGAPGAHDDTLTIDLTEPIALGGGIDYDGGAAGWDTLVLQGGAARDQRVTQLSPHDGVIDVDGLVIRYTNLEPITDTAPAVNFTVNGTPGFDEVTISDGPGGTTTISSPSFESVTFANKTNVVYDGLGGNDLVRFSNPNPATGLVSLIVTNVDRVLQTAALRYPSLGINATGFVSLLDDTNDVDRIEITSQNGPINYHDADDLIVGGVSPALAGVRAVQTGHVSVQTLNGNLVLEDTDGAEILKAGNLAGDLSLNAGGGASNFVVLTDRDAAIAPAGSVFLQAFGNLVLGAGGPTFSNDIRAAQSISMTVLGSVQIGGLSTIASDAFGTNSGGDLSIFFGGTLTQTGGARIVAAGSAGADLQLLSGTGSIELLGTAMGVESTSGNIWLIARGMIIAPASGITAPLGEIELSAHGLNLGAVADVPDMPVELSDAELDRMIAPVVVLHNLSSLGTPLQVTQPITFTSGTELILRSSLSVNGAGGSVSAPILTFEFPSVNPLTWTITPASVQINSGGPVPYSGVTTLNARGRVLSPRWAFASTAPDTFHVAPSPTTTINVDGWLPTPPASPGDVLDFDLTGVVNPVLTAVLTANGYQGTLTSANRQPVHFQNIERLVDVPVDLRITKSDGAAAAAAGTPVTYTITVTNPSAFPIGGATVTDAFPAALTGATWTCAPSAGSACTASGSGNINDVVTVAANGSLTYTVRGTLSPSATGTLTNTASVTTPSGFTETDPSNNSATDTTAITAEANLVVQKTTGATIVDRGEVFSYTITLQNAGPSDAQSVTLTDTLPANAFFVSLAAPAGYACTTPAAGASGTITCTRAVLPPSATADVFTLTVRVDPATPPGSTVVNTVTVTSATTDPSPANAATASVPVRLNIPTLSTMMLGVLAALIALLALRAMRW